MVELIEYFNQSGFTDLIRIFLIIGGLLSLIVFFIAIWFFVKISRRVFKHREQSMLDYYQRKEARKQTLKNK
ncbi:hypothetical protein [Coprobacter fastidiosus]|uniref:hypothetical protein n=1 Tax=Coprobacter fastidiosus TaxID=1099853 RepID=UPI003A8D1E47